MSYLQYTPSAMTKVTKQLSAQTVYSHTSAEVKDPSVSAKRGSKFYLMAWALEFSSRAYYRLCGDIIMGEGMDSTSRILCTNISLIEHSVTSPSSYA